MSEAKLNAGKKPKPIDRKKIDALLGRMRTLLMVDSRSPDEILGYDEFGLPRPRQRFPGHRHRRSALLI